jgi:hypothetical protein
MLFGAYKYNNVLHQHILGEYTFEPNKPLTIGIGFIGERVGLRLGYGFEFLKNKNKVNTEFIDLQYHYYGRKFLFDAILQNYKGFHLTNKDNDVDQDLYNNLSTFKSGIFGQYVFNHDKFSYRAAYNLRDQQIKSSGSFLLGAGIYYSEIHFDGQYLFEDSIGGGRLKLINFQMGPSAGYAHSWVIAKKIIIFASISAGINLGFNGKFINFTAYPTVIPRFAVGYNMNSWSFNFSYVNDVIYSYINDNSKIGLSSGSLQLSILKRFNMKNKFYMKVNNYIDKLLPGSK